MANQQILSVKAAKEEGMEFLSKIAFALNFLLFALEVALFGFHLRVDDALAEAVSPWMGPAAVFYLGIQVGSVVVIQNITRLGGVSDILMSVVMVGYLFATLIFGDVIETNGSLLPWDWQYTADLFKDDFIKNFGTAMVFELLLILTTYIRFFQQQTEVSNAPR